METRNLIVPVDFSEGVSAVIARAALLGLHYRVPIHLLHVVGSVQYPTHFRLQDRLRAELEDEAHADLEKWRQELEGRGCVVTQSVEYGKPASVICEFAGRHEKPLIIMGTAGHSGIRRAVMGSVAERTLRSAPCPVLAVREDPAKAARPFERVLVATDFSRDAEFATQIASEMCRDFGAELHLVHALHLTPPSIRDLALPESYFPEPARKAATTRLEKAAKDVERAGLEATGVHLVEGVVSQAIGDCAAELDPDLIVIGTRGHTGLTHLVSLGSVAERVLRGARCSVLVVKARGS